MVAIVQRVESAELSVEGEVRAAIGAGFVVLLGVAEGDTGGDADLLAAKVADLRILDDGEGRMNVSLRDAGAEALVVSQFTLLADCRKGRRPSFTGAAAPDVGRELYEAFVSSLRAQGIEVATGVFGARMLVGLRNDGPVTIILDSRDLAGPRRRSSRREP